MPIIFGLVVFLTRTAFPYINDCFGAVFGQEGGFAHYIAVGLEGLGVLGYVFSRRLIQKVSGRRILLGGMGLFCLASMGGLLFGGPGVSVLCGMSSALFMGFLEGEVFFQMSGYITGVRYPALAVAVPGGAAISLQFLLQRFFSLQVMIGAAVVALAVMFFLIFFRKKDDEPFENQLPYAADTREWTAEIRRQLILLTALVLCFEVILMVTDQQLVAAHFAKTVDPYGWPRLIFAGTYFLGGLAGSLKKGRYFPVITLCAVLVGGLFPFSVRADGGFSLLMLCGLYFALGFEELFLFYGYLSLASRTGHPELWAGFGRLFLLLEALWGIGLEAVHGTMALMAIQYVFLVAAILTIQIGRPDVAMEPEKSGSGSGNPSPEEGEADRKEKLLTGLSRKYSFTPREREVAAELIFTEDSMKEIAERLYISERVLYRYSKSIYDKTGSGGRPGLVKKVFEEG